MERLAGLEPACIALEERCLNPLGHRRAITAKSWYRGRGSNSTSPLCRRGALNQKATPALWLWGQDSNLRVAALTVRCLPNLATPEKLGREPGSRTQCFCAPNAEDYRFPCSRTSNALAGPSGFEPEFQASETRALNPSELRPQTITGTGGRNRTGISSLGPKCPIR